MRTNQQDAFCRHRKLNSFVTAMVFIAVGIVYIGHNMNIVDDYWFNLLISWQMLLIVIGLTNLFQRKFWGGLTVLAVGTIFLLPEITDIDISWVDVFWPLIFIVIGLSILFKRNAYKKWDDTRRSEFQRESFTTENGFVVSDNTFGSVKQIVLDPVFKGARIRNTFGGTVLDLRRTKLDTTETFIDVECSFGGIEIYLPTDWNLQSRVVSIIGGCDDKRYCSSEIDKEHTLIVRGSVTFGGIEYKS